jgi:hypothetical protein
MYGMQVLLLILFDEPIDLIRVTLKPGCMAPLS